MHAYFFPFRCFVLILSIDRQEPNWCASNFRGKILFSWDTHPHIYYSAPIGWQMTTQFTSIWWYPSIHSTFAQSSMQDRKNMYIGREPSLTLSVTHKFPLSYWYLRKTIQLRWAVWIGVYANVLRVAWCIGDLTSGALAASGAIPCPYRCTVSSPRWWPGGLSHLKRRRRSRKLLKQKLQRKRKACETEGEGRAREEQVLSKVNSI